MRCATLIDRQPHPVGQYHLDFPIGVDDIDSLHIDFREALRFIWRFRGHQQRGHQGQTRQADALLE